MSMLEPNKTLVSPIDSLLKDFTSELPIYKSYDPTAEILPFSNTFPTLLTLLKSFSSQPNPEFIKFLLSIKPIPDTSPTKHHKSKQCK